ncbi:MAG: type VI secretion system contractile sheath large subunit [Parachlamydia sp.]|nr:type VI secretion system contractile sheath large subunit [Parachlamydia sp.]
MTKTETLVVERDEIDLNQFLKTVRIADYDEEKTLVPMLSDGLLEVNEEVSDAARFISSLATLIWNIEPGSSRLDKSKIQELIARLNQMINDQVNEVIHHEKFKQLESTWRGLFDLVSGTNFRANVMIDMLDVSKDELQEDFEANSVDFASSALFQKVYVSEYDQYGGKPYGSIIGLYDFEHTPADLSWLKIMGKIANASHAPFIGSVKPQFFGCESIEELASIKDLEGLMNHPKYSMYNALRETEEAAYLGLCLPSYILRLPWHPVSNPCSTLNFTEYTWGDDHSKYLWGNPAALFAKNLVRSFQSSGWCQYVRGPKGGGLINGLPVHTFNIRGEDEIKIPVEMAIPDYRELEFANCGFIPLIYRKGSGEACFFSAQSVKKPKSFRDPKDSENAQMVCNLPYTYSVTRIAHYVKSIVRDNIGSSADADYIKRVLNNWISDYVTTTVNPDDRTLRRFPFKAAKIEVKETPGRIGWYNCKIFVLPHIQMEGMDVELRLETRLGNQK